MPEMRRCAAMLGASQMTLAILTVSCLAWVITREAIFEPMRKRARSYAWAYPLSCMYCLTPWLMAIWCVSMGLEWEWFIPAIWLVYWNLSLYAWVRKKAA